MKVMEKVMSAAEAVKLIKSEDRVAINGFSSFCYPEALSKALGQRFLDTNEPKNLSYFFGPGLGESREDRFIDQISYEGMVREVIASHIIKMLGLNKLVRENKIEGYNIPFGPASHMFRAAAGRKPGILTKVGLKTFVDPRNTGGAMNSISKKKWVELMTIDGEEYLFYKSPKVDVALLRGTTADKNGNITFEKEAFYIDPYTTALSAKANGGKVIVQVERISSERANPRQVKIPGILIDAIVVDPAQMQSIIEVYNPAYTGDLVVPDYEIPRILEEVARLAAGGGEKPRSLVHKIIARRAAMELKEKSVVNLGVGIPELVPSAAKEMGAPDDMILTVEAGLIGGFPSGGLGFGAAINPEVCQESAAMFDLYDSGTLDITFVGAMQVDQQGNVNVGMSGDKLIGVGGFVNLTQSAKKCVFCVAFGGKIEMADGKMKILEEGKYPKFVENVAQISASGEYAIDAGQEFIYVTERCVFYLLPEGLTITEIAPGLDLEKDIIAHMPFRPQVAKDLKVMESRFFV